MRLFPLIHSSSPTYNFIKPLTRQQLMLKLPVQLHRLTHFESTCCNGKSKGFSCTWSDHPYHLVALFFAQIFTRSYIHLRNQTTTLQEHGRANSSGQATHLHLKDKGHSFEDSVKPFFLLPYSAKYSPQTLIHTLVETLHFLLEQVTLTSPLMGTPIQWFLWAFD